MPELASDRRPLRIALLVSTLEIGGTEKQACRLAIELAARGHAVRVIAQSGNGPLQRTLEAAGIECSLHAFRGVRHVPAKRAWGGRVTIRSLRPLLAIWRELRRWRPDVCQAYGLQTYLWNMAGARVSGIPVRIACRRDVQREDIRSLPGRVLLRATRRCTTHVVANCAAVAAVAQLDGTPVHRITVIPNAVDIPTAPSDVGTSPAVGLNVANLYSHKGHGVLLDALRLLNEPPKIMLIGEGPERERLEARVRAEGLGKHVQLLGSVADGAMFWRDAKFGILASYEEGMSNAVMEAMAYGVPVVATAVGGITELIEDGVSGLLVRPNDAAALAKAMTRLASDPKLRVMLGARARERAQSFNWAVCTDRYLEVYRSGLGARR